MIRLAMVGETLIHNYPYGAWFNGVDDRVLEERCTKAWMKDLIAGRFPEPRAAEARITHVWAGERVEAEAIAACCHIENVCDSVEQAIEPVDGVLVLDEEIDFRTETVERCLRAGKSVFVDKTPALDPQRTRGLVELAQDQGVRLAAWSQLLFAAEAAPFREVQGGAGLVTFNLAADIVDKYGIHLVCSAFAAFGDAPMDMTQIADTDAPMVLLSYADGKDVLLRSGDDLPARGTVVWAGKDGEPIVARLMDMAAMFDGSAAALTVMFEQGEWPVSSEALVRMSEAARLLCP
ncbi:MAG: hypothetical protein J7M38_06055 [Armatimonadetes bacterium]|nr:hypothetical protein [Armatimonadota bacterium]